MNLYILIPYKNDEIYDNYMNKNFKFDDFDKYNTIYNIIYINGGNIVPNYNIDYLLVCDIQSLYIKSYYDKYMPLFKKEHKICFIYECLSHNCHNWKIKYIFDNFGLIFQNMSEFAKLKNVHWIPTCNLYIKHDKYNIKKTKFCAVSPIFDIGLHNPIDNKRIERVNIIKEYCDKNENIHIYGTNSWVQIVKSCNYIGKLPNEDNIGIVGKFDLKQKIINKCKVLSEYKFILVFENMFIDGYITEKFVESMYSDNIVIYYGPKNIKTMYPDLFNYGMINGHEYNVDNIIDIMNTMTDDEYNKRVDTIKKLRDNINFNNSSEIIKKNIMSTMINYIEQQK